MNPRFTALPRALFAALALALAGCGSSSPMNIKVWPFGSSAPVERPRGPQNAEEFQCAAGKRFHLRRLDGGEAVWLILPERELRLERIGSSQRYGKGATILELGEESRISEGATSTYQACKPPAAAAGG